MSDWTTLENGDRRLVLTEGDTVTLPADWSAQNVIACYGAGKNVTLQGSFTPAPGGDAEDAGGGAGGYDDGSNAASPGGGGAYAAETGLGAPNEAVSYQIGAPGAPDTWAFGPNTLKAHGSTSRLGGSDSQSVGAVTHRGGNGHADSLHGGGGAGPDGPGSDATESGPGEGGGGEAGHGGVANDPLGSGKAGLGRIVLIYTPA